MKQKLDGDMRLRELILLTIQWGMFFLRILKHTFFYDPYDQDNSHAKLITSNVRLKTISSVELPGAGHPVGPAILQTGLNKVCLDSILDNNFETSKFKSIFESSYKETAQYYYVRSRQFQQKKDYSKAKVYAEKAVEKTSSPSFSYYRQLGCSLLELGEVGTAYEYFSKAKEISVNQDILFLKARAALLHGDFDNILTSFLELYKFKPDNGIWKIFVEHNLTLSNCKLIEKIGLEVVGLDVTGEVARTLGGYYHSINNYIKAAKYAKIACEKDPYNDSFQAFLSRTKGKIVNS
ncbi:tetratricopeptide repeat protein [Vibrio rotiferianus]|uniref:tetratricopeptide repeat protein n=1 Tax=Vibrio rotiferianus TaxID=190895 RepID=UPI0015F696BF|nr:hypothetical protein [Vibrio rotiferianus]